MTAQEARQTIEDKLTAGEDAAYERITSELNEVAKYGCDYTILEYRLSHSLSKRLRGEGYRVSNGFTKGKVHPQPCSIVWIP